jgi:hypothetical protein
MLREQIESLIKAHSDPQEAAIQVCIMLEDELDLRGNGWFDDDDLLDARFDAEYEARLKASKAGGADD